MKKYTNDQFKMMLAIYYLKGKLNNKNISKVAYLMSKYFSTDFSSNDVIYCLTKIKSVDPSYKQSTLINKDSVEWKLWKYYIIDDRIEMLREILKKLTISSPKQLNECANQFVNNNFKNMKFTFHGDNKKDLYKESEKENLEEKQTRSSQVIYNALKLANFKCEYGNHHTTFIRKNTLNIPYTEGHHLIPLKYQNKFEYNLDVEANVVSLCSNCHNQLHYGKDVKEILSILLNRRISRLERCGIKITLKELIKMYQ